MPGSPMEAFIECLLGTGTEQTGEPRPLLLRASSGGEKGRIGLVTVQVIAD